MEPTQSRMLDVAAEQFAEKGYAGASMRSIASATGITQAAIYHHYPNKEALYQAALSFHFEEKNAELANELEQIADPEECMRTLVRGLLEVTAEDQQFRQLYFRELLEGDEQRLQALAQGIFGDLAERQFRIMKKLAPAVDPILTLLSVAGLVCHHVEARKLSPYLPGSRPEQQELNVLADHISNLLLYGVQQG
jgi:AcrR family transcriptional regulator